MHTGGARRAAILIHDQELKQSRVMPVTDLRQFGIDSEIARDHQVGDTVGFYGSRTLQWLMGL